MADAVTVRDEYRDMSWTVVIQKTNGIDLYN